MWLCVYLFCCFQILYSESRTTQITSSCLLQDDLAQCSGLSPEFPPGTNMTTLQFSECGNKTLTDQSFTNIVFLQKLTITCNGRIQLAEGSFDPLLNVGISDINIVNSPISTIPVQSLCQLKTLQTLRIHESGVENVTTFGFGLGDPLCIAAANLRIFRLTNNHILSLPEAGFGQLKQLDELDLSGNRIEAIHPMAFSNLTRLRFLNLDRNRLSSLPHTVFITIRQMASLYMNFNMLNDDVFEAVEPLVNLEMLLLSCNHIDNLNSRVLGKLHKMVSMMFDQNKIKEIPPRCFANMSKLGLLNLDSNNLSSIKSDDFAGLIKLVNLWVANNSISSIHPFALSELKDLRVLNADRNQLEKMPNVTGLEVLYLLNVSDNVIHHLPDNSLDDQTQFYELDMSWNKLKHISRSSMKNVSQLTILNLSHNQIETIEPGTLNTFTFQGKVYLNNNKLSTIKDVFGSYVSVQVLNLSSNHFTTFKYVDFPKSLVELYLAHNNISSIISYGKPPQINLKTLDLSNNQLKELNSMDVPNSIVVLNLDNNYIEKLGFAVFLSAVSLKKLFLRNNSLKYICSTAIRNQQWTPYDIPTLFLKGNPFRCTCEMLWLRISRSVIFAELENLRCTGEEPFQQHVTQSTFDNSISKNMFWCKTGVGASSSMNSCDCMPTDHLCWMPCPKNCTCYRDHDRVEVITRCFDAKLMSVPADAPADTKIMLLNGNVIRKLTQESFKMYTANRLQAVSLKQNSVNDIEDFTFEPLNALTWLNLNHNQLQVLTKNIFVGLTNLKVLYLDNNKLKTIDDSALKPLKSLQTLYLNDNNLVQFSAWHLTTLSDVNLARNPWSCNCEFVNQFRKWFHDSVNQTFQREVYNLTCTMDTDNSVIPMVTINDTVCLNMTQKIGFSSTELVASTVVGVCVPVLLVAFLLFYYRKEVQVLIYARFGIRLFRQNRKFDHCLNTRDKVYDVFVCYSSLDDQFLLDNILPGLEINVPIPYLVCLHQRDFLAGAFITDAILEAVSRSKVTLLLLSNNFLESDWCRFEFKAAHLHMLQDPASKVIVVLLQPKLPKILDPEIKLYLKTNTYLCWGDKLFWKKLYFALPQPSGY